MKENLTDKPIPFSTPAMKHNVSKTAETNKETTDMETEEITMNENVEKVSSKKRTRGKLVDKEEPNNRDNSNKNTDNSHIIQKGTKKLEQLDVSIINDKNINNAKRIARLET